MATMVWEDRVGESGVATPIEVRPASAASLRELYRSQFEPMVRVATALLGDRAAAEDVVQDAFVSVGRKLPTLTGSESCVAASGCRKVRTIRNIGRDYCWGRTRAVAVV